MATPWGVRLTTAEHVVLDVVPLEGAGGGTLVDIDGYPSLLEKRCHHYRRMQHGTAASWTTVLIPRLARTDLADLTTGWTGWWEDGGERGAMDLEQVWMETAAHPGAVCTWERTVDLPAGDDLLLELPRTYAIAATLDGVELEVPELGHYHSGEPICQSPFVALPTGLARRATLRLRFVKLGSLGPTGRIALHRRLAVPPPVVSCAGDRLTVELGRSHVVDLARVRSAPAAAHAHVQRGEDPLAVAAGLLSSLHLDDGAIDPAWWSSTSADRARACCASVLRSDRTQQSRVITLLSDPSWDVRLAAAAALVHLGTRDAVPGLLAALDAETPALVADKAYGARYRVRELCLLALHRIGDPATRPVFERCLTRDEFYGVRRLAAAALRDLGTVDSLPALQAWTGDADGETSVAAKTAITAITGRSTP